MSIDRIKTTEAAGPYERWRGTRFWTSHFKKPPELGTVRFIGDGLYYLSCDERAGIWADIPFQVWTPVPVPGQQQPPTPTPTLAPVEM